MANNAVKGLNTGYERVIKSLYLKYFKAIRTKSGRAKAPQEFKDGIKSAKSALSTLVDLSEGSQRRSPSVVKALREGFDEHVEKLYGTYIRGVAEGSSARTVDRQFRNALARARKALDETIALSKEVRA